MPDTLSPLACWGMPVKSAHRGKVLSKKVMQESFGSDSLCGMKSADTHRCACWIAPLSVPYCIGI
jgi:hypothetical protein